MPEGAEEAVAVEIGAAEEVKDVAVVVKAGEEAVEIGAAVAVKDVAVEVGVIGLLAEEGVVIGVGEEEGVGVTGLPGEGEAIGLPGEEVVVVGHPLQLNQQLHQQLEEEGGVPHLSHQHVLKLQLPVHHLVFHHPYNSLHSVLPLQRHLHGVENEVFKTQRMVNRLVLNCNYKILRQ